jgi:hypothetical protein
MNNLIIESERIAPMIDGHPYDQQCPLARDNQPVSFEFIDFLAMHT